MSLFSVFSPSPAPTPSVPASAPTSGYPTLNFDQISKAQKLCKFAISSLDYQDSKSAVENLNKAIYLIQTGQEMQWRREYFWLMCILQQNQMKV